MNGVCQYTDEDNFKNIRLLGNNKNGIRLLESSKGDILLTTMTNICLYNSSEERFEPVIYDLILRRYLLSIALWTHKIIAGW